MTISAGTRLGPYEVIAPIGAGGMGEVYKAKDTRLDRTVAIKVLPEHLAESPERKARFEREAKAISQLNHPHICTLYDVGEQDGIDFIVMEYIEGETLAERLKKGALKLDQAIEYAIQIAEALGRAHNAGIVHRDLKPANVVVTSSGVKLLDFGLARLVVERPVSVASDTPTLPRDLTKEQVILGTLHYMAPEQLQAAAVDARADIWAFGCVLYEMLTGKRAFEGKSQASLIGAIMNDQPQAISTLQPLTPSALERLVKKCLAKEADRRWQTTFDLKDELSWVFEDTSAEAARSDRRPRNRERVAWMAAGLLALVSLGVLIFGWRVEPTLAPASLKRFAIDLPEADDLARGIWTSTLALSPDGKKLVYGGSRDGVAQLFLRPMGQMEAAPLSGTEHGVAPFFSPDGEWIAFFAGDQLKKIASGGGPAVSVCDTTALLGPSGTWGPDGNIIFSTGYSGLWQVPADGGTPEQMVAEHAKERSFPQILPDGKHVLFGNGLRIAILSLETEEVQTLLPGHFARFVPTGHIVFEDQGTVWSVPFNVERHEVVGTPVPVLEPIHVSPTGVPLLTVSRDGTLVYVPARVFDEKKIVWVDRDGAVTPVLEEPRNYLMAQVSPDGRRALVMIQDGEGNVDIWALDFERGALSRQTRGYNFFPVWSPDGNRLAFGGTSTREQPYDLYWKPVDGTSEPEILLEKEHVQRPYSFSPDGAFLTFSDEHPETGWDIWVLSTEEGEATPFSVTPAAERTPMFSPDGKWIAFSSDESGRFEIYVRSFPDSSRRHQISTNGGLLPRWSRNGQELFFVERGHLVAVPMDAGDGLSAGPSQALFRVRDEERYDVSADGTRFLVCQRVTEPELHVVLDWFEELEHLVPTDN